MKRLALVLAAAAFGTGCGSSSPPPPPCLPSVTVDWSFRNADGIVTTSCATAGVTWVDVFVNGAGVASFDCFGPPGVVPLAGGTNDLIVEGVDVSGIILYRDRFSVNAGCGSLGVVASVPAEGRVNLDYAVPTAPTCAGGPCYLWFSVQDDLANQVAAVVNATSVPTSYPYPNDVVFRLPQGPYTVQWMQVVSGGFAERQACATAAFDVTPGDPHLAPGQQQIVPVAGPIPLKATCP